MTDHARAERMALADTLAEAGPHAPTLCTGWNTGDLAAHLVIREGNILGAAGILLKPLAGRTTDAMRRLRQDLTYPEIVDRFANGASRWSPSRVAAIDNAANTVEFFVHHEDVRRAPEEWRARKISDELQEFFWRRLRGAGRLLFRRAAVGVLLARPDGAVFRVRAGEPTAVLAGRPSELTLYAFGRKEQAKVELSGPDVATEVLRQAQLRV